MTKEVNARQLMSDAKFYEGYSRWDESIGRYETWDEAVDRVMNTHRTFYKDKLTPELNQYIDKAGLAYKEKLVLGAQRALQFGGEQLLKHQMKLYNCTSSYADRAAFFHEIFYILLCGAGAGFSVQKHHVAKIPQIAERKKSSKIFTPEDSIEGWADCIGVLMSSFFVGGGSFSEYEGRRVFFDLTNIRQKGTLISGGFKAPGPEPLRRALDKVEYLIQGRILKGESQLRPIDVYDIVMHIADAVLSGGVRRSATLCMFSPDDNDMMKAKTGNWFEENPQRGRSNNSAMIIRDQITRQQFADIMKNVREFGEPGFVFADSTEHAYNPCVTGETLINTTDGLRRADSLLATKFKAIVNGVAYNSGGFIQTGTLPVYKINTFRGHQIRVTSNHKMLVEEDGEQIWREAGDLSLGDKLVIGQNQLKKIDNNDIDFNKGWLVGSVIGDGGHNPDKYETYMRFWGATAEEQATIACGIIKQLGGNSIQPWNYNNILTVASVTLRHLCDKFIEVGTKNLKDQVFVQNDQFLAGLIQGYFDADGTVFGDSKKQGLAVRLCSNNYKRLTQIQTILNRFGIVSSIYAIHDEKEAYLPDGKGGNKFYNVKATYDLHFSRVSVDNFIALGGFRDSVKKARLLSLVSNRTRTPYKNHNTTEVVSIEFDGIEDVYDCCVEEVHRFEANGLIIHNCVEIGMIPHINNVSGWQGCNLVEQNGGKITNKEIFLRSCEAAAILGTLQAGYTSFPYLTRETEEIFKREALLGVSITGWMNNPAVLFDQELLREGARVVKAVNRKVAKLLGINPAARTTCSKPAGNASVLLKTASGFGAEHSPKYIRHVQMNKETEVAKLIKTKNPYMVEDSVWSEGKTDYVIAFPVVAPPTSIFKNEMHGVRYLEKVKLAQQSWVEEGTDVELCVDPTIRHNISNTVTVFANQWDSVEQYVYDNRKYFAGISFLGANGDKDYDQAPNTEVLSIQEMVDRYNIGALFASGLVVDALKVFPSLWQATKIAQNPSSVFSQEQLDRQSDWIRRFDKFAENYFEGNVKTAEYCLKDAYLLHKWTKIQQNYQEVDFLTELQAAQYIDIDTMGAAACVNGGCEI